MRKILGWFTEQAITTAIVCAAIILVLLTLSCSIIGGLLYYVLHPAHAMSSFTHFIKREPPHLQYYHITLYGNWEGFMSILVEDPPWKKTLPRGSFSRDDMVLETIPLDYVRVDETDSQVIQN